MWPFKRKVERELDPQLLARLRPFVAPRGALPSGIANDAPEIFPGVVVAVAVHDETRVDFVLRPSIGQRQTAIENLRKLPLPPFQTFRTEDLEVSLFEAQDDFVAARVTFLDRLAEAVAPARPGRDGVMVSIPRRRTVLLHVLGRGDPDRARDALAITTASLFDETPHSRLSRHVYYVEPDGRAQVVV